MVEKENSSSRRNTRYTRLEKILISLLVIVTLALIFVIIYYQTKSTKPEVQYIFEEHVTENVNVVTESDVTTHKLQGIYEGRKPKTDDVVTKDDGVEPTAVIVTSPKQRSDGLNSSVNVVTESDVTTHKLQGIYEERKPKTDDVVTKDDGVEPTTVIVTAPKQKSDGLNSSVICNSRQCVDAAYLMMHAIDENVNPCENFYQYACGGWQKESDHASVGGEVDKKMKKALKHLLEMEEVDLDYKKDILAFKKARMFYSSCMDTIEIEELGFTPAKKMLDSIGKIYHRGDSQKINLTQLFYELLIRNGAPFFHISTHAHHSNNIENVIYITSGKYLGILSKYHSRELKHQLRDEKLDSQDFGRNKTYVNTTLLFNLVVAMSKRKTADVMIQLLGIYMDTNTTSIYDYYKQRILERELLTINSELQSIKPSQKQFQRDRELGKTHKTYSIGELQRQFGMGVDWKILLQLLFRRPFGNDEKVLVLDPTYMKNLNQLFLEHGERIVNNAALILYADSMLKEITYGVSDIHRWELCVDATKLVLPEALSAMYIRSFSRQKLNQIQSEVNAMFKDVKEVFKRVINNSKWLDNISKDKMKLKIEKMTGTFGIHDILYNNTYINKAVENLRIDIKDFFGNVISGYKLNSLKYYDPNFNKSTIDDMIFKYLTMDNFLKDNAFYAPNFNALAITLGQQLPPYFDLHLPKYITYGSLGFTIAHELSHGFDTSSISHNEHGNKNPWMPSRTMELFKGKTECFRKMYETSFEIPLTVFGIPVHAQIDGKFTLNDNIADNSGIDLAYEAYKSMILKNGAEEMLPAMHLNPEQMFFLSVAQPFCANLNDMHYILLLENDRHSPNPERVNALMMNSEKFVKAFQCSANSAMNLKSKCKLW